MLTFLDLPATRACRDVDPDLFFFPEGTKGGQRSSAVRRARERAAVAVCNTCPVIAECRAYALGNGEHTAYGVWGGLTEAELMLRRPASGNRLSRARATATVTAGGAA